MTERIGFVGLGNMGAPMAANLARAGYAVVAFDVRREALRAVEPAGIGAAASPRAVADRCETVLVCLPTPAAVDSVVLGEGQLALGESVRRLVDLSTSGPRLARRLGGALADKGIETIEAPVSGGVGGARAATLAIMVSGPAAGYRAVEPILRALGKPFFVGEAAGLGQTMKLVNNMVSGAALAITAEAMALGAKAGIDPAVMIEVLNAGSGRNTATLDKFPKAVLTGTYDYGFATELMFKDAALFIDEAEAMGLSLRTAHAVRQLWFETFAELGPTDFTAIARFVAERTGVSLRAGMAGEGSQG
jgi:3-hydroxyisobutyrate dehydrogenase-like beta-hydroxyacid dehydrogenase